MGLPLVALDFLRRVWVDAAEGPTPGKPVESEHWDVIAEWADDMEAAFLVGHDLAGKHATQEIPLGTVLVTGLTTYTNVAEACVITFSYTLVRKTGIVSGITDNADGSFIVNMTAPGLTGEYQPIARVMEKAPIPALPAVCTGLGRGDAARVVVSRTSDTAFQVGLRNAAGLAVAYDCFVAVHGIGA